MDEPRTPEEYIPHLRVTLLTSSRVPVDGYGGIERVVAWLAKGLAELGHEVTLVAPPGSRSPFARMVEVPFPSGREREVDYRAFVGTGTDVVHAHHPQKRFSDVPFCWTLHGNALDPGRLLPGAIGLSLNHARRHGLDRWVHNGLDPADYLFNPVKSGDDLFLGRLHRAKGWRWAVDGARRAGRAITVAGGWRPTLRPGVRFVGRVGGERKRQLLGDATCLWMPAQWDEPFGLTTIEAMASGTPVLGTRRGALPEIISGGAGAMGDTLDELVALRPQLDDLDPARIRQRVLDHFTHRTMAARYLELYRELIAVA